jgi:hypothetical protein
VGQAGVGPKGSRRYLGVDSLLGENFIHSVISIPPEDENFLRLNFYSKVRWRVSIDPTKHYFDSKFEIKTTVHKQAEWRRNLRRRGEAWE